MAFKSDGKDLSTRVYGFGTAEKFGEYPTFVINSHYKIGGKPLRAVAKDPIFMPFSIGYVDHYLSSGSLILPESSYAGVNRFVKSSTVRYSAFTRSDVTYKVYYKAAGFNGLGTLRIGDSYEIKDCPPVICVYGQGAGGNGGGSRKDGIFVGQTFTCGGGGGSGAFWAFYLQMPYDTGGVFQEVLSIRLNKYVSFSKNNVVFSQVGAGGDGQTPNAEYSNYNGGAGGTVSMYKLPSDVKSCCFKKTSGDLASINDLKGAAGGKGGTGGAMYGVIVDAVYGKSGYSIGKESATTDYFYIDSINHSIPPRGYFTGGLSGGSSGGGGGGGGGGSRMGTGGKGGKGGDGFGGGESGSSGGLGAGGGGGSIGGAGFETWYNGGTGGSAYFAVVW